ncbi:MAG TPA: PASTA domain-containing protein, partial [Parasegetibacter sp.]
VYVDSLPGRVVVKQFPEPEVLVKVNRTIYLTVNRVIPPMVEMPNLINMSYRSADDNLRSFGLKMGDTSYQPDFAKNAVIHQRYNGTDIKPGTKIPMGSTISLVFGSGISNEEIAVPDLFGLTLQEAEMLLSVSGLRTGAVVKDANVSDSLNAYIYKQSPERLDYDKRVNRIRPGQLIDVWLSRDKPVRPDPPSQIPGEEPSN